MKRELINFIPAVLLLIITVACQDKIPVTDLKLDKTTLLLSIGGTVTLKAEAIPYNAPKREVNWSSSNSAVATVVDCSTVTTFSEGLITAHAEGTAIITATTKDGKYMKTCTVTVINAEPELIRVEGEPFTMGCTEEQGDDCRDREFPRHQVTLNSFYIAKYTVTQKQWEAVMGANPSEYRGEDLPVVGVSWGDVQLFIVKLNTLTGKNYRLPTEAEWEYAARGGNQSKRYKYSGSNNLNEVAWYYDNSSDQVHPVGNKKPNELGIYDMSGNVFEWCSDWYSDYTNTPQVNPTGPAVGTDRILRGGCNSSLARNCRVAFRSYTTPSARLTNVGFRLAHP
ncbi:MAG: SUMF1/EgtB/PvdO family nonheme iron enzyme [Bacteroidetes bacterium]|nr:SUMF1/EgtB/PvdO family nonheme iron enzyme [Bacteroidota bacterium]MCL2302167.1 SUMF1/EgtB/PvdO family nonheme iron enzyme [Lentimicrobiaceae bacterium]